MSFIKEMIYLKLFGTYKPDLREFVPLSDGGRLMIEYKFVNGRDVGQRPILLFLPGLTDNNESRQNCVVINEAIKRKINVILLN